MNNGTLGFRDVMRGKKIAVSLPNPATYSPKGFVNVRDPRPLALLCVMFIVTLLCCDDMILQV